MRDLGSAFRGFAIAKTPFNCSSGSEGSNTNLPELVLPWSPLEVLHAAAAFLNRDLKGQAMRFTGVWPLVGAKATHIMPKTRWAVNRLAILLLWHSRLATIVSLREFGPVLTNYCTHHRTSNFLTDGTNCRVAVFRPGPLQWICKEWVQKLGSDEATTCFGDEKHIELNGPMSQGEGFPCLRMGIPNSSRILRAFLLSLGLLLLGRPPILGDLYCYIFLSSVHPPPTLVSHPCLFSSAHPIDHSF